MTEARARALRAHGPADRGWAENALTGALTSLFPVVEAYPDLRASGSFQELQRELWVTEDRGLCAPVATTTPC